jgi:hypothetical protein
VRVIALTLKNQGTAVRFNCLPYRSVGSKLSPAEVSPETGTSAVVAGDFRQILVKVADFEGLETIRVCAKTPQIAGILRKN